MSGKPYRSQLNDHESLIFELRGERPPVPYQRIAEILAERFKLVVTHNAVFSFFKTRKHWNRIYGRKKPAALAGRDDPSPTPKEAPKRAHESPAPVAPLPPRKRAVYVPKEKPASKIDVRLSHEMED